MSSLRILLLATGLAVSAPCFARDASLQITGGKSGHGFFRGYGPDCYVIVPRHLLGTPGNIVVTAPGGATSPATIFHGGGSTADLATLVLPSARSNLCHGSSEPQRREVIAQRLQAASNATLRYIEEDGSSVREKASINRVTSLSVIFTLDSGETIQEGMSGSTLLSGSTQIGMLVGVEHGSGVGIRQEVIEDYWDRVKPVRLTCENSCDVRLSDLTLVNSYSSQSDSTTTHLDYVYRVPEDWPWFPYIHILVLKIDLHVTFAGRSDPEPPAVSIQGASFSTSPSERASEEYLSMYGFENVGTASGFYLYQGRSVRVDLVGGPLPPNITLRIKSN